MTENVDAVHHSEISAEFGQCQRTSNWRGELDSAAPRSFSRVALEQAAGAFMAANVGRAFGYRLLDDLVIFLFRRLLNQLIDQALTPPFEMIMISELRTSYIHESATENYKVIQAFLDDALEESLDSRPQINKFSFVCETPHISCGTSFLE
jgi:hypothetical protein